jgi:hypothetical protein
MPDQEVSYLYYKSITVKKLGTINTGGSDRKGKVEIGAIRRSTYLV